MLLPATLLTLLTASAPADGVSAATTTARPRIVALGDSLTSGHGIGASRAFPAVLQERLQQSGYALDIVNAGVSGDTTGRALLRFREALRGDVRVLVVALGANDGLRGVPVSEVRRNLSTIIQDAQSRGIAVLLCGMEALPMHGWNYTVEFHQAYVDLARQYDVPLVPFMMLSVLGNRELMQPDHVHPNAAGARLMADHVWPYLDALLRQAGYLPSAT
ncbi:MAG: arylesterase [Acidobacteria bacterium]|nr:arylesterase [Acidobacteriota bacterium]